MKCLCKKDSSLLSRSLFVLTLQGVVGAAVPLSPLFGADCFDDWPEGKDPVTVSRRLTDLFLSTSPDVSRQMRWKSADTK